ncbi:uncharacterized protein LOC131628031 [Vicia villosa]|uniref:uncharacterized protein LOC131628031 n=1 Tax=Vicia villosa TaxID=3911 RepID=UPI00273C3295|nr:uncharacterized protein LOC131628031 [Vicia villosa]
MSSNFSHSSTSSSSSSSLLVWWKDLISIGNCSAEDPIVSNCRLVVGNGYNTPFWESCWADKYSLKERFSKLFELSSLVGVSVASMGGWVHGVWKWGNLGVDLDDVFDPLVVAENDCIRLLLSGRIVHTEGRDKVEWSGSDGDSFSVASCYEFMAGLTYPFGPPNRLEVVKDLIWKVHVPFNIKAFGWRIFINRLPTKDLLMGRGILLSIENSLCAFCGSIPESSDHSFFKCKEAGEVWREITVWVGKPYGGMDEDCNQSFMDWFLFCKKKKVKEGKCGVLWLAIVWIFWLSRNGFCFRNEGWNVDNTVWNIKSLLWKWSYFGEITHLIYSFYEFTKDPLFFLS